MQSKRDEIHGMILARLAQIAALGPMLKGTVCEAKRGARKRGTGERTAYLLTYKAKGNKTKTIYVPAHRLTEVRDMVARHREATGTLDRIVELSVSLFRAK